MAPTFPNVDVATLKALRKGDVSALQRIHRAAYDTLIADAGRLGGDPSIGPPAVELAMLQLWETRGNIESPDELDSAIHAALRGGVTREQRRRAASKEPVKAAGGTVDSTWAHIAAEIAKMPATTGTRKHGAVKHHVEHVDAESGRGVMIAVGVVLLIAAAYGGYRLLQSSDHGLAMGSYTLQDAKTVSVTPGQRGNLPLGPGDTAAIGSDSKITVGGDYGAKVRAVQVDGSANFRVSKGPRFEVDTKDVYVFTNEGAFAVRAYKDDPGVIVRVKEGEVAVTSLKGTQSVAAGKSLAVAKDGTMSEPSPEAVTQALGWTDGTIAFTNTPLKEVMSEFARWYNLPVTTKDTSLYSRPVTMSVALESKKDAIAALEQSASVKFTYDKDSKPVLEDAPPKPATPAKATKAAKKKGK